MPVRTDGHGRSKTGSPKLLTAPETAEMFPAGVKRFMVDATLLSTEQTQRLPRVAAAIATASRTLPARLKDASLDIFLAN